MAKTRFYATNIPKIGITAIYNRVGDLWLERLFVPKVDLQFVERLPLLVNEILESEFKILEAQWNVFLMLAPVPEPTPKKIFTVEEKFIPKTKYLIKKDKLEIIGYSENNLEELKAFFDELFKDKSGLIMRDSSGIDSAVIPFNILEKAEFIFNEVR